MFVHYLLVFKKTDLRRLSIHFSIKMSKFTDLRKQQQSLFHPQTATPSHFVHHPSSITHHGQPTTTPGSSLTSWICVDEHKIMPLYTKTSRLLALCVIHAMLCAEGLSPRCFVGFDLGTSGARISIIQQSDSSKNKYQELHSESVSWSDEKRYDDPEAWMGAIALLLEGSADYLPSVTSICISGTSASCLLIDRGNAGTVTRNPRMYDFDVLRGDDSVDSIHGVRALARLEAFAPAQHTTRSPTSSLAKLLAWHEEVPLSKNEALAHQADYLALQFLSEGKACGSGPSNSRSVSSDWHNCLKLGYDVQNLCWPSWIIECISHANLDPLKVLPEKVLSPGEPFGTISHRMAERFGLPEDTIIVGGTTDSNAAFFASCSSTSEMGIAVTSLGSTLAIKQTSRNYIEDATVGVYSHRFPSVLMSTSTSEACWLVGGASNVGCAVLRQQNFSNEEIRQLSELIDPNVDGPYRYYPLTKKGERFPVADSHKEPVLQPVPDDRAEFLRGLFEGISDVECSGYAALAILGADPLIPHTIFTSGGGSRNEVWRCIRQRRLTSNFKEVVHVLRAQNSEPSFGAAVLAAAHLSD